MDNSSLPISNKRRRQDVEIIDLQSGEFIEPESNTYNKVLDHLPQILDIAESIIEINRMQIEAEERRLLLREQGELLHKEADAFVKKEMAKRDSFRERADKVQNVLNDLYLYLNKANDSDEVKKLVIDTVNNSIDKILIGNQNND